MRRRIAIGRQVKRHTILHQQGTRASPRVETTHADVEVGAEHVFTDNVDSRHVLQSFLDREGPLHLQGQPIQNDNGARQGADIFRDDPRDQDGFDGVVLRADIGGDTDPCQHQRR